MSSYSSTTLPNIYSAPILIVDDNIINQRFLEAVLTARGYTNLLSVGSGEEALEQLLPFRPELVILDIMMPGMDGFECCTQIRKQPAYQDLPILIQTTITEPELKVKAFEQGATDFVSKPIYPDELTARVKVHLEKRLNTNMLVDYKERLESELQSAAKLQFSILPKEKLLDGIRENSFIDVSAHYQPSLEIGGDFWGIKQLSSAHTAVWAVDFSGHGIASALNAFSLQNYLKEEESSLAGEAGLYLSHLNDKLLNLLSANHFATMFYGIIDSQEKILRYACAATPHPIILRSATGKAELIRGNGLPLGINIHAYKEQQISFMPGDMLILYSDAFLETQNHKEEMLAEQDIINLCEQYPDSSSEQLQNIILGYFDQHSGQNLNDDLTMVVCKLL